MAQPDGKLVASGCGGQNATVDCDAIILARYNANGSLDTSFDGDGVVVTGPAGTSFGGRALALQPDGKLVVATTTAGAGSSANVVLARFNAGGSPDTTFDGDGVATGPAGSAAAVTLQPDGRIVLAGDRSGDLLVVRYESNGGVEPTFGAVTTDLGTTGAAGVLIQTDGKVVVSANHDFSLARYLVTGGGEVADLAVTVADAPDPVASGGNLTYTVTVANGGPQDASRVELTLVLSAGSDFLSAVPSQGLCMQAAGTVTCTLNGIVVGDSATVTVAVSAGPRGSAVTTASATSSSTDSNPANNSATATTTVQPGAGAWTSLPALGGARQAPTAMLADGRILLAGGLGANPLASAEIYDPVARTSTSTGSLSSARSGHTLTTLADGRVLATGGLSGFNVVGSAEIWNPATGTWSATRLMATGHAGHTAVRLDDGRVLVVGGIDLTGAVCPGPAGVPNSAEIYNPATDTWAPTTGNARYPRIRGGTTTKLADGTVLAVGGYYGSNYVGACNATDQNAPPSCTTRPTAPGARPPTTWPCTSTCTPPRCWVTATCSSPAAVTATPPAQRAP